MLGQPKQQLPGGCQRCKRKLDSPSRLTAATPSACLTVMLEEKGTSGVSSVLRWWPMAWLSWSSHSSKCRVDQVVAIEDRPEAGADRPER